MGSFPKEVPKLRHYANHELRIAQICLRMSLADDLEPAQEPRQSFPGRTFCGPQAAGHQVLHRGLALPISRTSTIFIRLSLPVLNDSGKSQKIPNYHRSPDPEQSR